mmetsp:Transcript_6004/g.18046  ORF Transcript_6004/g.18046 Transcript_6004/m.18046 type:complete len:504 (-) Transcript_6004:119-1630(-)
MATAGRVAARRRPRAVGSAAAGQRASRAQRWRRRSPVAAAAVSPTGCSAAPSAAALLAGAELARVGQVVYKVSEERAADCEKLGLRLVDAGETEDNVTQWCVVEGRASECASAAAVLASEAGEAAGDASGGAGADGGVTVRFVVIRGVADGADRLRLSAALANTFGRPLVDADMAVPSVDGALSFGRREAAREAVGRAQRVVAHAGLLEVAEPLRETLASRGHLTLPENTRLCLVGHSLGSALATVITASASVRALAAGAPPGAGTESWLPTYCFGTLHALAWATGDGGSGAEGILECMGLPADGIRSYILESDPVPRSFSASPAVGGLTALDGLGDVLSGGVDGIAGALGLAEVASSNGSSGGASDAADGRPSIGTSNESGGWALNLLAGAGLTLPQPPSLPQPPQMRFGPVGMTYLIRSDGIVRDVEAMPPLRAAEALALGSGAEEALQALREGSLDLFTLLTTPFVGLMDHSLYSVCRELTAAAEAAEASSSSSAQSTQT